MSEPKYYDELPTYIMHSDGEFENGTFKAVDGNGNSLTIGTEKSDTEEKLTIEGADKAIISNKYSKETTPFPTVSGTFAATIGEIAFEVLGTVMTIAEKTVEGVNVIFLKGSDITAFSLPTLATITELFDKLVPKNIRGGSGAGGVISGIASGENACVASGENSFAGGLKCIASGENSMAFGWHCEASGESAVALNSAVAEGESSTAMGSSTATGYASFACNLARSSSDGSFGSGSGEAAAEYSAAFNLGTSAEGMYQTAIGKWNAKQGNNNSAEPTDYAFIIGNGTGKNTRSNALAVRWDGASVLANGTVLTVEQLAKVANLQ